MQTPTAIDFYVKGRLHASRSNVPQVPRIGETVRLKDGSMEKVTDVVWCLDVSDDYAMKVDVWLGQSK